MRWAFREAVRLDPGAARGVLGLHLCAAGPAERIEAALAEVESGITAADAALLRAAWAAWSGDLERARRLLHTLITGAPPGRAHVWHAG